MLNVQCTGYDTTHTISELRQLAVEHTHKSLCAAVQTNSSVHKSFYFLLVLHIVIGRWLVGSSDPNLVTYYASASQFWQTDAQRRFPRCTSPYVVYAYVCVSVSVYASEFPTAVYIPFCQIFERMRVRERGRKRSRVNCWKTSEKDYRNSYAFHTHTHTHTNAQTYSLCGWVEYMIPYCNWDASPLMCVWAASMNRWKN